jgi:hypothetical protein
VSSQPAQPRWRWSHTGDPLLPQQWGVLASGQLRDVGVTVEAFQFALGTPCPVCGEVAKQWRATMVLPPPITTPLPVGEGCTPDHAVAGAPTSWAAVAGKLTRETADLHNLTDRGEASLAELARRLSQQASAAAFLADLPAAARRLALQLWANDAALPITDVATALAGALTDPR